MSDQTKPVYLNTAACGLIPASFREAAVSFYREFEHHSSAASEQWRDIRYFGIKENAAAFIGAAAANIAFVPNCSYALNAIVHALNGKEKILLYRGDYPSLYHPFLVNNFDITWIDDEDGFLLDMDKLASLIRTQEINIVVLSHVQWQSGFAIDLAALGAVCRQQGALLIVDATQSLGALDIDVSALHLDVLISSNYKWMNAGFGCGLLYMSDAFLQSYPPRVGGNGSRTLRKTDAGYEIDPLITNYEPGSLDMFGLLIMDQSIKAKRQQGMQVIAAHNRALTIQLLERLKGLPVQPLGDYGMTRRSSIVSIREEEGLHAWLQRHHIITTCRNGLIRISMHTHNTPEDIEALVQCLEQWPDASRQPVTSP